MGSKLGIYLPSNYSNLNKGDVIEIKIKKDNKESIFISKYNYNITLRKPAINNLNLNKGEVVEIELQKLNQPIKPKEIFRGDKIDLLALIPEVTSNGYQIFASLFTKDNNEWLRVWYCHERGSCNQIEIKKLVSVDSFGRLLGQLQAEGTKSGKRHRLEFCNKLIDEHIDYIKYLEEMGMTKDNVICKCDFHPKVKDIIEEKIKEFEEKTNILIKYKSQNRWMKGDYSFKTHIQNSLLTEIILGSLDILRKKLVEDDWEVNMKDLADSFLAKLLTGDGTLDITSNNRGYDFPIARISITDGNLDYLKDYAAIIEKLGFNPKVLEKHIRVRSYLPFDKMLYLYKIKAFQNTPNWKKLILLINENLKGRRLNTHLRLLDLDKEITTSYLVNKYNLSTRAANNWLNSKEREGFLLRVKDSRPIKWKLTYKAEGLVEILNQVKLELAL